MSNKQPEKILTRPEVVERVGVSYVTLWTWMQEGKFPLSRGLGGNRGKIGWLESEISEWIRSRPVRQYGKKSKASATAAVSSGAA
jgi:predicted DNA-binding transcriptional regulator AlpA